MGRRPSTAAGALVIHFDGHGFSGEPADDRVDTVALVGDERLVVVDLCVGEEPDEEDE